MVVASEVGVMDFEPGEIKEKGRLQPGKILMIDTEQGKIYYDGELKEQLASAVLIAPGCLPTASNSIP